MFDLALSVITCSLANRFRGGGFWAKHLPGHPRFYIAPLIGFVAAGYQPWPVAATIGLTYLFFVWLPWGRWFTLNRMPRAYAGRKPSRFEMILEYIADFGGARRDWLAFSLRNMVVLIPGIALVLFVSEFSHLMPSWNTWPPDILTAIKAGLYQTIFAVFAIIPAFGATACYWLGWQIKPMSGTQFAEWLVGACVGILITVSQELL